MGWVLLTPQVGSVSFAVEAAPTDNTRETTHVQMLRSFMAAREKNEGRVIERKMLANNGKSKLRRENYFLKLL